MHKTYKSNLRINYLKWLRKWKGNIVKTLTLWRRAPKIKVPKNVDMYNSEEYIMDRGKKPNINTGQDSGKHYKNILSLIYSDQN